MFQIITLNLTIINIKEKVIDIAALRKAKKIKQAEMAEMQGINQSQISEIERGIRPVSAKYEEILIEQLDPFRTPGGILKYRPEDVEVCKLIRHLLRDKGYSLEYAKKRACRLSQISSEASVLVQIC